MLADVDHVFEPSIGFEYRNPRDEHASRQGRENNADWGPSYLHIKTCGYGGSVEPDIIYIFNSSWNGVTGGDLEFSAVHLGIGNATDTVACWWGIMGARVAFSSEVGGVPLEQVVDDAIMSGGFSWRIPIKRHCTLVLECLAGLPMDWMDSTGCTVGRLALQVMFTPRSQPEKHLYFGYEGTYVRVDGDDLNLDTTVRGLGFGFILGD